MNKLLALVSMLCMLGTSKTQAQTWTELSWPCSLSHVLGFPYSYFVTTNYGFIACPGSMGTLNRTIDSGNTWRAFSTGLGSIVQLDFLSPAHGYCAKVNLGNGGGGIYETTDSGASWQKITNGGGSYPYVYAVDNKIFAIQDSAGHYQLWRTTNDGLQWDSDLLPSGIIDGMPLSSLVGNRENLIALLAPTVFIFSTDQGSSWNLQAVNHGTTGDAGLPALAIPPHSCYVLEIAGIIGNDNNMLSIYRSEPPFLDWTIPVYSQPTANWFGVNDCEVYTYYVGSNNDTGLMQSTDQGKSWTFVKSPIAPEDDVNGALPTVYGSIISSQRAGILYIFADTDGLDYQFYRWTDSLLSKSTPSLSFSVSTMTGRTDTLYVCDTARLKVAFQNNSCAFASFDSLSIEGLDSGLYYTEKKYHSCGSTLADTVLITIVPRVPGTYPIHLVLHFVDGDYHEIDTSFATTLLVGPNPGTLFLSKRSLDFGTESLCAPIALRDSFIVSGHGCEQITIDTALFRPDSASKDFTFKPVGNFTPPNDSIIYFPISFLPSLADTERGSVLIFWNDGEAEHTDTIRVQGAGVLDTRSFSIQPPTLTVKMCDSVVGMIYITNTTCGFLQMDSLSLPSGVTLPLTWNGNPQLPLDIPQGKQDSLVVDFSPGAEGTSIFSIGDTTLNVLAHVKLTEHSNTTSFDTVLALQIRVERGPASVLLSDTALNFGTFARCNAIADTIIMLTNSGCDSLSLSGASVDGGSGFTLVGGKDTVLAPNESVQYKIHFSDSITGGLASALHIHAIGAHGGNAFDTSISFSATIIPGSHLATLNRQAIDFGTTSICEERDSSITITNVGCEPDTITSAAFLSNQFIIPNTLSFPIILLPGCSAIIPILTSLDTAGHPVDVMDSLDFISNLDLALPAVVLSRGVIYPGHFSLGLKTEDSAAVSATVPVYVLRKGTIPVTADELDFDLIYDEDLLGYSNAIEPDIQPVHATLLPNGLTDRSFAMKPATDRDTIATLEFNSYLARQEHTPLTLANQKFLAGGLVSPPCVASIDSATGTGFTLELACGDGPLVNALTGLPLDLVSMNVSPDALAFTLDRGDATLTSCSAEVLNVLGAQALQKRFDLSPVTTASFDLRALPAGAYFLRIAAGRSVITRRFVVVK